MNRPALILGLTLCEDVVSHPDSHNISLIRAFTRQAMDTLPGTPRPFCLFAALTAGLGQAEFTLEILGPSEELANQIVSQYRGRLQFGDPLQTVYWVFRLTDCSFAEPGEYLFTLWIDGQWMAHRRLRVYLREDIA